MKRRFISFYSFIKQVAAEFTGNSVLKYSASLAYYTIFSLAPMLVIIISVCGILFGREAIQGELYNQIKYLVGNDAALQIQETIKSIHLSRQGLGATIVSVIILLIGATGIFNEIQDSLNKIWGLKVKARKIWWKLILDRLISFSLIVSIGFVLMVSLGVNAIITLMSNRLSAVFTTGQKIILPVIENLVSFFTSVFLFAIIFKVLPDAKIKWKDVIIGAMITAFLFAVGKAGIGYYVGKTNISSVYGAAGSVMVILVWTYYSSVILYLGAVFTKIYSKDYGGKILPNDYSVWIKLEETRVNNIPTNKEVLK